MMEIINPGSNLFYLCITRSDVNKPIELFVNKKKELQNIKTRLVTEMPASIHTYSTKGKIEKKKRHLSF